MKHKFGILGAGPAGLQLGYFFQKSGQDYVILERADRVGSFFERFPRSGELISFNRRYGIYDDPELKLRWDWNSLLTDSYEHRFTDYSRRLFPISDEVLTYLAEFAKRYQLNVELGFDVTKISKGDDGWFTLTDSAGRVCQCQYLIVATGVGRPFIPDIPGIEHTENYENVTINYDEFENKRVLIIGKGNSGFEVANAILDSAAIVHVASPNPVQLAWRTRHSGHVRAQYTRILDSYQLKTLHSSLDCDIQGIEPDGDGLRVTVSYAHADGERETFNYDRVICCAGFRFENEIFDDAIRPALDDLGRFPRMTSDWESVDVPNLFFCGTLTQARDFKRASSAFIAGFRYNTRTLHRFLRQRDEGQPLASTRLALDADALAEAVLARVNRTAALWVQFGYLCDAIVLKPSDGCARYYEEVPRDYVFESRLDKDADYFVIDFEWGKWAGDVFAIDRHPEHGQAHTNVFVHPIVRAYHNGEQIAEHHILEDLLGMFGAEGESGFVAARSDRDMRTYHRDEHEKPLKAFFTEQLAVLDTGDPHPISVAGS